MTIFGKSYVLFKRCIFLISAIMLLVVRADEKQMPSPDGADVVGKNTYVLYDYFMSNQGVTNDGEFFYFSGKKNLAKADMRSGEIIRINTSPIPDELQALGCDHIGGLSYYDGRIYAALEDGPEYQHPFIVLYDAQTLAYTGQYYALPQSLHLEGVPWCAVDAERHLLYTAEWSNAAVLNVFRLEDLQLVKTLPLSEPIDRMQGGELFDDKLYLSCDEENDRKRVCSVDVETGEVQTVFARNVGRACEAEDMTVFAGQDGQPVFCVLDRGARRKSMNLTFYTRKS